MPTQYTEKIGEGCTFKEYALMCARAFGALVHMRDEPMDATIKELETHSSYMDDVFKNMKKIAELNEMDMETANQKAAEEYDQYIKEHKSWIKAKKELEIKYNNMLDKVYGWKPPTKEHNNLKKFMEEQIEESIKYDCDYEHYEKELKQYKKKSGKEWLEEKRKYLEDSIAFNKERHFESLKTINSKNVWISNLLDSL